MKISISQELINEFCIKNHIKKFSIFGSFLREDFAPESDIDILVEFEEDHIPGFFSLAGMEEELTNLIGIKTDIRTKNDLSVYFREEVLNSAVTKYVKN